VSGLTRNVAEQLDRAYRRMAGRARFRPGAPSDGFGNITVPEAELDVDAECRDYAVRWAREEDSLHFFIGCCNFSTREATVYLIEAARALCGANNDLARDLLKLVAGELGLNAERSTTGPPG
jgi:hypothetical protein